MLLWSKMQIYGCMCSLYSIYTLLIKRNLKDVFSFVFVFTIDMWFHLQPWLYFLPLLCYLVIKNKTVWNMLQMTLSYLFYFWVIKKSKFFLLESSKPCLHTWTELWHCWTWLLIDLDM